jgi:hypothetical protein
MKRNVLFCSVVVFLLMGFGCETKRSPTLTSSPGHLEEAVVVTRKESDLRDRVGREVVLEGLVHDSKGYWVIEIGGEHVELKDLRLPDVWNGKEVRVNGWLNYGVRGTNPSLFENVEGKVGFRWSKTMFFVDPIRGVFLVSSNSRK